MASVLLVVTGSDYWTLADGTRHPCGFWPEEVAVPHQVFREAGFEITIATPGGVTPTPDKMGFTPEMNGGSTEVGQQLADYLARISDELESAVALETVDSDAFDLVFVPGGHGPMEDLVNSVEFGRLARTMYEAGKPVAAVCHGPAALLAVSEDDGSWFFDGFRLTAFSNVEEGQVGLADQAKWLLEDRLRQAGAVYSAADEPWGAHMIVDHNLYTGQNPASSKELADRLVVDVKKG